MLRASSINPVLPIFADTVGEGTPVLGAAEISALIAEQHRSVLQCFDEAAVRLIASSGSEDRLLSAAFLHWASLRRICGALPGN